MDKFGGSKFFMTSLVDNFEVNRETRLFLCDRLSLPIPFSLVYLCLHDRVLLDMILTSAVFNEERRCLATNITDHKLVEVKALAYVLIL